MRLKTCFPNSAEWKMRDVLLERTAGGGDDGRSGEHQGLLWGCTVRVVLVYILQSTPGSDRLRLILNCRM